MPIVTCRHFSGYKPCTKNKLCNDDCPSLNIPSKNILLIHLGAIGAVLRSTSLLKAIHKKYPNCRLIWVTESPAHQLLLNHPLIDQVYTISESDLLELSSWEFDTALVVDKSRKTSGILKRASVKEVFGFQVEPYSGAILPATKAATELWEIGLNNDRKFFSNQKPETRLVHEALELGPWTRNEYHLALTDIEIDQTYFKRATWVNIKNNSVPLIGLNTGCSSIIPNKKWTIEFHRKVIRELLSYGYKNIVLLGGAEDAIRNQEIGRDLPVSQSPTNLGLRDGLTSAAACDIVISGDSLGMHMAIAMKKFTIAWFGPTCSQEIDLYNRGIALKANVTCAPCWKRSCDKSSLCYDQVDLQEVLTAVKKGEQWWRNQQQNQSLLFKRPSLETSF